MGLPQGSVGGWDGTEGAWVLCAPARASRSPLSLGSRLAIQAEENEMLKAALDNALRGKEEDFRMYHETLGQVKGVFLKALRQQKEDKR